MVGDAELTAQIPLWVESNGEDATLIGWEYIYGRFGRPNWGGHDETVVVGCIIID